MCKAWIEMWKNTFNYTETVTRKGYWLALIMNVIAMYVGVIPYALLAKLITDNYVAVITVYLVVLHLPVLAIYFRRARGAGWKITTAIFLAVTIPVLSGLLVGIFSHCGTVSKGYSLIGKAFALSFGLFFYGGVLGIALYGDPTSIPFMPIAGILLASSILIIYGIVNWREVLAFFTGSHID